MSKTIDLKYPVEYVENETAKTLTQITLRRLKAKHLRKLPADFFEKAAKDKSPAGIIPVIAVMSDIPIVAAEEIDVADLNSISEEIQSFLA